MMSSGTDISALYSEFTAALTEVLAENRWTGTPWAARKGSRRCQEAPGLQRCWVFSGSRNSIPKMGSHTERRSLGSALAVGATLPLSRRRTCLSGRNEVPYCATRRIWHMLAFSGWGLRGAGLD